MKSIFSFSAIVAGIFSWIINVGTNFACVSPSFKYKNVIETDRYCDILDLARDIATSYIVQTIKQSYKVVLSMHLLGDPTLWAHQVKTGFTDLFVKTGEVQEKNRYTIRNGTLIQVVQLFLTTVLH